VINHLPRESEDWESSKGPAFLVSFGASRAGIPVVRITRLGDIGEGQSNNLLELTSDCHRSEAHSGSQGIDSRGQPSTLGPFLGGFTGRFQQAEFRS